MLPLPSCGLKETAGAAPTPATPAGWACPAEPAPKAAVENQGRQLRGPRGSGRGLRTFS